MDGKFNSNCKLNKILVKEERASAWKPFSLYFRSKREMHDDILLVHQDFSATQKSLAVLDEYGIVSNQE